MGESGTPEVRKGRWEAGRQERTQKKTTGGGANQESGKREKDVFLLS
jgi:hypothetical protein